MAGLVPRPCIAGAALSSCPEPHRGSCWPKVKSACSLLSECSYGAQKPLSCQVSLASSPFIWLAPGTGPPSRARNKSLGPRESTVCASPPPPCKLAQNGRSCDCRQRRGISIKDTAGYPLSPLSLSCLACLPLFVADGASYHGARCCTSRSCPPLNCRASGLSSVAWGRGAPGQPGCHVNEGGGWCWQGSGVSRGGNAWAGGEQKRALD